MQLEQPIPGEAYVAAKWPQEARPLLERVVAWARGDEMREKARELLAEIDGATDDELRGGGG